MDVYDVIIIGSGPAGLTAAKSLADRGANVVLVERSESLGGMARELTCKGLVECRNCGACFAIDRAAEVLKETSIEVLLLSDVVAVKKDENGFEAKVKVVGLDILFPDPSPMPDQDAELVQAAREFGDSISIEVKDTGIGIAASDLPKLFEAFERLENKVESIDTRLTSVERKVK